MFGSLEYIMDARGDLVLSGRISDRLKDPSGAGTPEHISDPILESDLPIEPTTEIDPVVTTSDLTPASSNDGPEPNPSSDPAAASSPTSPPVDQGSSLSDRDDGPASSGPNKLFHISPAYS